MRSGIPLLAALLLTLLSLTGVLLRWQSEQQDSESLPDVRSASVDLVVPAMAEGPPAPGQRVKQVLAGYEESELFHALYLPVDWEPDRRFPILVEYPGNGPYSNRFGDTNSGRVEDCELGYGITAGKSYLWVCLPFVSEDHQVHQLQWWGDADATADYCVDVVEGLIENYGGDQEAVFLAGFSRGSIACNYIGLRNDRIAALWAGFLCHSHYDGVRQWDSDPNFREAARVRIDRLAGRPQWISHENSIDETRRYLSQVAPEGNFTFHLLPFRNHTDCWVLRDTPSRAAARAWLDRVTDEARTKPKRTGD